MELSSEHYKFFKYGADDGLAAANVLPAIGAVGGKEKALIDALVAEGVSTGCQGWVNEELKADGTAELVGMGLEEGFWDGASELWVGEQVLSILGLFWEQDLNFDLPSLD